MLLTFDDLLQGQDWLATSQCCLRSATRPATGPSARQALLQSAQYVAGTCADSHSWPSTSSPARAPASSRRRRSIAASLASPRPVEIHGQAAPREIQDAALRMTGPHSTCGATLVLRHRPQSCCCQRPGPCAGCSSFSRPKSTAAATTTHTPGSEGISCAQKQAINEMLWRESSARQTRTLRLQ